MLDFIIKINQALWNGPVLIILFTCHLYFTLRSRFVQRHLGQSLRVLRNANGASALRALFATLAATLGTGNIIGMSAAVAIGGPGAVFWCWLTGIFGMATTYAECNLCLQHRDEPSGDYGAMHLLKDKLHMPKVAFAFAVALLIASACTSSLTQSNALAASVSALTRRTDRQNVLLLTGIVISVLLALLFSGKLLGIRDACSVLVPSMSAFFVLGLVLLLLGHLRYVPEAFCRILKGAFSVSSLSGGLAGYTLGAAIRQGVAKGLFTNEAGLGTAPLAALTSKGTTPVEQSLVSMSATFFDTVFLCGITGIALVSCMLAAPASYVGVPGSSYLIVAFGELPLFGSAMLHISIITFALATLLGWSYFGEKAAAYLAGNAGVLCYRFVYLIMIVIGSVIDTEFVWEFADLANTFLLLPNLYLLFRMRKEVTYPSH